jgi:uncharacterized protein (TIGR02453 family)
VSDGKFSGWTGDFKGFFLGLKANNSKAYFEAHRKQYEQDVKAPMIALLAELEPKFGPAHLSRPNRDIRFSADKSPYKTNIYADAHAGGYVALDADGLTAAGGRYMMDPPQLAKYREAVADLRTGGRLASIVEELRGKGYDVEEPVLKRVPSPYPQDHARGELLRQKRLIYWRRWPVARWIASREALERVSEAWRDGDKLNKWLGQNVGESGRRER